jgi:hypothetical protein
MILKFFYFPACRQIWLIPLVDDGQPAYLTNLKENNTSFSSYIRIQDLKNVNEIGILIYELGFWKLFVS